MNNDFYYNGSVSNVLAAEHNQGTHKATGMVDIPNNNSAQAPLTARRTSIVSFKELTRCTSKHGIPAPIFLRCPETSHFNSGTNENKKKQFRTLKKEKISRINFLKRTITADEKYRFSEYEAVYCVDGMMHFISSDVGSSDLIVICGHTEDTDEPVVLMKFGSQAESFLDDEDVNIVQPDFFVAKLVVDTDEDSCYTANFSYFANDSKLSCNLASELPDATATGIVLEIFASMAALMGSKLLDDSEVSGY